MPSGARRRRTNQEVEEESEDERFPTQGTQRGRRQVVVSEDEGEDGEEDDDDEEGDMDVDRAEFGGQDKEVKKLIRYVLACEYQRIRITRAGISEKAIGKQRGSAFKAIFEAAQKDLRIKFGMQLVPLPANEKVTVKQKRAAAKTNGNAKSSTAPGYILTSILPPEYKSAEIMPPSIIGSQREEAQYIAVCTIIISLISLSPGGCLPDSRLHHHLQRLNLEKNTPVGSLNDTLSRMRKDGYIHRVVDSTPDEETTDWYVGPRGKVEMGSKCIRGFVHEVYGDRAPEDLDKRLQRSLGLEIKRDASGQNGNQEDDVQEEGNGNPGPSTERGRRRRADTDDD